MAKRAVTAAAVCALFALLAGCSSASPKANYSSVSTSPSDPPSASRTAASSGPSMPAPNTTANVPPGATEPQLGADAKTHDINGATAFAVFYWQRVNWAYSVNSGAPIEGLFTDTCASCASFVNSINTSTSDGYLLYGGHIAVKGATLTTPDNVPGADYGIDVSLEIDQLESRTSTGAVASSFPPGTDRQRMYLGWIDGGWKVVDTATVTVK